MYLAALTVENYRAIGRAEIGFDQTTVLIGENDCGKSSLLEALAIALDPEGGETPPRFHPWHFHRTTTSAASPAAGPIRLVLRFAERQPGEWDALAGTPLGSLLQWTGKRQRAIVLEIRADATADQTEAVATWRLRAEGAPRRTAVTTPAALACLRRLNPLIWLHGGGLIGVSTVRSETRPRSSSLSAESSRLIERIQQSHAELVAGTAASVQAVLGDGFEAAREFITLAAHHLHDQQHNFRQMVAEILDQRHLLPVGAEGAHPLRFSGSSAERIGILALLAAVLRAIPDHLEPGAEPIWILEDPEAELHPMTLASVLELIRRVDWQKIVTTQSAEVLAAEPMQVMRRLTRQSGTVRAWRVRPGSLSAEDVRRVSYHLRARRGVANFARCWLLVEGESEFWIIPEMARIGGHNFAIEGVVCVEFAQCGLPPLIKLARELGIEWHLLTDGDAAGQAYAAQAAGFVRGEPVKRRITVLPHEDIETCFYEHGYESLFRRLAGLRSGQSAGSVIRHAIERHSKPLLALELILAAATPDSPGVPPPIHQAIDTCVALSRGPAT